MVNENLELFSRIQEQYKIARKEIDEENIKKFNAEWSRVVNQLDYLSKHGKDYLELHFYGNGSSEVQKMIKEKLISEGFKVKKDSMREVLIVSGWS